MIRNVLFRETQYFRQWWIWALLVVVAAIPFYGIYKQIILGKTFGTNPMSNTALLFYAGAMVLFILFFLNMRLVTWIAKEGIYVRFFPFHTSMKFYPWETIETCYIRKYKPLREYGGWGLRYGFGNKGMALNVSGNTGLQLRFANGNTLLIGTQKPGQIENVLISLGKIDTTR